MSENEIEKLENNIYTFPDLCYRRPRMIEFNLEKVVNMMPVNSTITGIGKRKSGKTEFLKWFLIKGMRDKIPWGWAFTHTKHNLQLSLFMPQRYIISKFEQSDLKKILKRQTVAIDLYLKNQNINPRSFVIWDDYNGHDITYNESLTDYYMTGRHYQTLNLFFIQYKNMLPPAVRLNTDYLVLWNCDNLNQLEQYWIEFAGKMTKEDFFHMFFEYTEKHKHGFIFIDTSPVVDYNNKFYYGIADLVKCDINTILGCEEYWRYNQEQLNKIKTGKLQKDFELINDIGKKDFNKKTQTVPTPFSLQFNSKNTNTNKEEFIY